MPWLMLGPFARKLIPELELCRSDFELSEAAAKAKHGSTMSFRESWPVIIFVPAIIFTMFTLVNNRPYWFPMWAVPLIALSCGLMFASFMANRTSEMARRRVRRYLLSRGIPICQGCGYDLRGLAMDAGAVASCPECGSLAPLEARA